MAKILMRVPNNPYNAEINTHSMEVELREVYVGVGFVTENDVKLSVCMRDDGFEVRYHKDAVEGAFAQEGFDTGWMEFKHGIVKVSEQMLSASELERQQNGSS